ncbi:MAG: DUF481 domain-containing protein [Colwellia sp.]|nr:DUF481 domain-containing protein [Colwellia sp.]
MYRFLLLTIWAISAFSYAEEDKFKIKIGVFSSLSDSGMEASVPWEASPYEIDFEDDLNLDKRSILPLVELLYQLNERHSFFIDWRRLHRKSSPSDVSKPFEFELDDEFYSIEVDANIVTTFNVDISRIGYGYNFYQNEKWDIKALIGLHVMQFELRFSGDIAVCNTQECDPIDNTRTDSIFTDITTPLPNFGISAGYDISDDWTIFTKVQYFYIHLDQITGELVDLSISADYSITDSAAVSLSYEYYNISVDASGDNASLDVRYGFKGPMLALIYSF